jgi:cell division protein ZapE
MNKQFTEFCHTHGWEPNLSQQMAVRAIEQSLQDHDALKGVYLWGPPGQGKTIVLDWFFTQSTFSPARYETFYNFINQLHVDVKQQLTSRPSRLWPWWPNTPHDPFYVIGQQLAEKAQYLCLDELFVNNIADATLLKRLFEYLIDKPIFFLVSSNTPPENLYLHGLNRERFQPFIEIIKERFTVVAFNESGDYRQTSARPKHWFINNINNQNTFQKLCNTITHGHPPQTESIQVQGRTLIVSQSFSESACVSFVWLCKQPLASQDYIALCSRYKDFFIENIPQFALENTDESSRFQTFIDVAYEKKCRIYALANVHLEDLFTYQPSKFHRTVSRIFTLCS